MLHWYLINTMEIIFGIIFLIAGYKFISKKNAPKIYKHLGLIYFGVSILSFTALGISVHVSGLTA